VEIGEDAVAEHRVRQRADVVEADVIAPVHQRPRLAAQHQVLGGANARAECHPLAHRFGTRRRLRTAGTHEVQRVPHDRLGDRYLANQSLERHEVGARHRALEYRILKRRRGAHDFELLILGRVIDNDVEHEAVELCLGQRICTFQLDRVLRCEDVERLVELVRAALNRHAVLLHRFEQSGLCLRRCAVDFVGEEDIGEDRTWREHHLPASGRRILLDDVGAGDVGWHQVGRELNPGEFEIDNSRERVDEQRLREPRHTDDQAVTADEERQQHFVDRITLTDDDLAQLRDDALAARLHFVGQRNIVRRFEIGHVTDRTLHRNPSGVWALGLRRWALGTA
jgi:hypothetical protein